MRAWWEQRPGTVDAVLAGALLVVGLGTAHGVSVDGSSDVWYVGVLILTTFDLDKLVHAALRAGASGFLLKDAPPDELLRAVRAIAAGDALIAASVTRRLLSHAEHLVTRTFATNGIISRSWSPTRDAFLTTTDTGLAIIPLDGSAPERIDVSPPAQPGEQAMSPDGSLIAAAIGGMEEPTFLVWRSRSSKRGRSRRSRGPPMAGSPLGRRPGSSERPTRYGGRSDGEPTATRPCRRDLASKRVGCRYRYR